MYSHRLFSCGRRGRRIHGHTNNKQSLQRGRATKREQYNNGTTLAQFSSLFNENSLQKANIRRRMTKRRNLRSTTKTVKYSYQRARGMKSLFDAFERNRSEHEPIGSGTGFPNCHAVGTGELRCRFISNSGHYFTYVLNERNAKETNKIKYGTTSSGP